MMHSGLVFLTMLALLAIGGTTRNRQLRLASGIILIGLGIASLKEAQP